MYQLEWVQQRVKTQSRADEHTRPAVSRTVWYLGFTSCLTDISSEMATGASWPALASVIALDRTGKGLRTAPRDALIPQSSQPATLATSFGVHRALDERGLPARSR